MIFKRSLHFTPAYHLTEAAEAAAARGSGEKAGRASQAPIKVITYYNRSHTRIELQAAAARGLDCCWELCGRVVALCSLGIVRYHIRSTSTWT